MTEQRSSSPSLDSQHSAPLAETGSDSYVLWTSPNGVDHAIIRGRCATCGNTHDLSAE